MSTPARAILRCALNPAKWELAFVNRTTGGTLVIPKGGGVDVWFFFLNEEGTEALDVSNIADLTLLVKASSGTWAQIGATVTQKTPNITLAQWEAGLGAHFIATLLGTDTNLAAGQYSLTVKGHTTDDAVDLDCFGISTLLIQDVGLTDAAPVTPSAATVESIVRPLMEGFLTVIGRPGVFRTEVSPNGLWRRIEGVDDDGQPVTRFEQVS
jgi:hypothetical protein